MRTALRLVVPGMRDKACVNENVERSFRACDRTLTGILFYYDIFGLSIHGQIREIAPSPGGMIMSVED